MRVIRPIAKAIGRDYAHSIPLSGNLGQLGGINLAYYYFKPAGSDTYTPIKLRKKSLLNALGSQGNDAKNYIKSQTLDCNDASDVIRLLEYLEGK